MSSPDPMNDPENTMPDDGPNPEDALADTIAEEAIALTRKEDDEARKDEQYLDDSRGLYGTE